MDRYKVFLDYVKAFEVEASSYEEAIRKAHEGLVISEDGLVACPENDYADLESVKKNEKIFGNTKEEKK